MSSDPIDNCRRCATPLCGEERMEDLCPACLAERTPATFEAARARYDAEAEAFTIALQAEIARRTLARHPSAESLHIRGDYGADGFTLRPVRVTAGAEVLDDMSEADLEDDIAGLLDWLGELTGDAYDADHELGLRPRHDTAATPPVAVAEDGDAKWYLVRWEIDLEADSAVDAARQALAVQRDPTSTATFFTVHPVHGTEGDVELDLLDHPGR